MNKLNLICLKTVRWSSWPLLPVLGGFLFTGYALAGQYGKNIPHSGPRFASAEKIPGALKLSFTHTDGGLVVKGDQLEEFSVCGEDSKWNWADARIEGETVVVSSSEVPNPVAARYAWQANPKATLFNGAGLPAIPFQTDDGGGTKGK